MHGLKLARRRVYQPTIELSRNNHERREVVRLMLFLAVAAPLAMAGWAW